MAGLLKPDSGSVTVMGKDMTALHGKELQAFRLRIGFSFQDGALYDSMTVGKNIAFALVRKKNNISSSDVDAAVSKVLNDVQLAESIDKFPSELSGGQIKRVGIARALVLQPEIMLYDEPTAGLDPATSAEINKMIDRVQQVKQVNFYGPSKVEVVMLVETTAQTHIHKDASAKISSDGFIGNKIIVIDGGSQKVAGIRDGDYINVASTPGTDEILTTLQANNFNLLGITKDIQTVSRQLVNGDGMLGNVLHDPAMANDLKDAMAAVKNIAIKGEIVMAGLQQFSNGLHKQGSIADGLVSDTVVFSTLRRTVEDLQRAAVNLNNASLKVSSAGDNLQNASADLNNTQKPVGMLLNDEQVARHLKTIILNLDSSSKKLDDDLEAVQHNFLLRGFFRKKEKQP